MKETIIELSCNIDDMTGEALGFAADCFFEGGALDVYTQPIYMKKNRPAVKLCVICKESDEENILHLIFKHTTTLGIRKNVFERYALQRDTVEKDTPFGKVKFKISEGYGVKKEKPEYDDIAEIAKRNNMAISDVLYILNKEVEN